MLPLNDIQKYQFSRTGSFIGVLATIFFLTRMSPWETSHYNTIRFIWLMLAVAAGLWCGIAAIYYRSKIQNPTVDATVVHTLAAAGSQLKQGTEEQGPVQLKEKD